MEYRVLARTGVQVSELGLGAMMFGRGANDDVASCTTLINRALDAGINHIDTADTYGAGDSERIVGQAIAARRDDVVLATKCYFPKGPDINARGGSRRWIVRAAEASLRRLGTDRIDLYYLHRLDPLTDPEESLAAMDDLVRQGKVLYVGTSGTKASQLVECQWAADRRNVHRPVAEQLQYSMFTRAVEHDVLPTCERYGVGAVVYGPLNGGWLSGRYRRDEPPAEGTRAATQFFDRRWWDRDRPEVDRKFDLADRLTEVAGSAGLTLRQLALGFAVAHPAVASVLIGPRTPEQLDELLGAPVPRLTQDVLDAVDAIVAPGTDVDPSNMVEARTGGRNR